jgi:DNA repair exonuclease SbcCD ATPase subunit
LQLHILRKYIISISFFKDIKAESEILSAKSYQSGPAELFSSQPFSTQDCSSAFKELQEKVKSLEEEVHFFESNRFFVVAVFCLFVFLYEFCVSAVSSFQLKCWFCFQLGQEKQNNAAIQIVLDQNDSRIKSLTSQLEDANSKLAYREEELHDMTFRLDEAKGKCQGLHKMLVEKAQALDEMSSENEELRKRHTLVVADLEKERKRYEKLKASSEQKTSDLQNKLETSLQELKKSQELVVSKSPGRRPGNTDADSFSVQKPATPPGSPQKDTFLFPTVPSPVITPTSSPSPSINFNEGNGVDLKHIIEQLKTERDLQNQKIVKLKAEQMKACKIIKSMIDSRNKTNEEIAVLKEKNEELERELEEVASKVKPGSDKGSDVSCSSGSTSNEVLSRKRFFKGGW